MPDAQRMTEIVEALYAATGVGDWDTAESHFTDDFRIVECDSLPYGGLYTGKRAMRDLFADVMAFWADPALELEGVAAGGGYAYGIVKLTVTSRNTGKRQLIEIAERFEFRDDLVCEVKPFYFDTHAIFLDANAAPAAA